MVFRIIFPLLLLFSSIHIAAQNQAQKSVTNQKKAKDSLKKLQDKVDFQLFEGKYDSVVLNSIENIKFAERLGDTAAAFYSRYIMAATFMYMEDFKNAHEYTEAYKNFAEEKKDTFKMARAYNLMGALFVSEKNHEAALPYFQKALPLSKKLGDTIEYSMVYYNLSESYLNQNDRKKAISFFEKAKAGFDAVKFNGLTTEMKLLEGKINLANNNPETAIKNFEIAIDFALKGEYNDDNLIEVYKEYSKALFENKNYKEAFLIRKKYDSLNSLQFEKEKMMAMQTANAQFSVNEYKQQAKQAELETELSRQKARQSSILLYIFIAAAFVLATFLVILWINYKRRKVLLLDLKEQNRLYQIAKEKSEELAKAKSQFFSTVSHELRTPLYGVIGLSTILLEDEGLKDHEKDLKHLKFSADYLLALINDVLQISKIESKTLEDVQISFDLEELINSIASSFEYILLQNKNEIRLNISEEIPSPLIGNRMKLSQILMNLVGNASKFTEEGVISIILNLESATDDFVTIRFEIKDTGVGIPYEKQQTIFEEFQQVDSHEYKFQGTGLGLPIVKKLLDSANTTIHLESEPGKGSSFIFNYTFKKGVIASDEKNVLDETKLLAGKNVLVVDDNRINQLVSKKILENHHLKCTIANNGDEAIEILKNTEFDLVLMDINMPGKNGLETTLEIRKFNKTVPIIALTAVEEENMLSAIMESGMDDIMVKPYNVDKFLKKLSKHIQKN
ncbi:response regulator [Aequorivita echinoideorum]|uniref:histidine kinase n=1 Tax=Aequorivita echinoideorum TaxID=1549647 RepID=A0ABS5S3D9_9FLAO|nr:response regulator [Aequorivita echinoideorum]MBT0606944.1 response regulator [Aequorivita echinoideorum]